MTNLLPNEAVEDKRRGEREDQVRSGEPRKKTNTGLFDSLGLRNKQQHRDNNGGIACSGVYGSSMSMCVRGSSNDQFTTLN